MRSFTNHNIIEFRVDHTLHHSNKIDALSNSRNHLSEHSQSINIIHEFKGFHLKALNSFDFKSEILFQFHPTKYIVMNHNSDTILEKSYGQQLTGQEIDEIINTEIRRHTTFIEKQIKL